MNIKSIFASIAIIVLAIPSVSKAQSDCDSLWDSLTNIIPHKKSCCDHCGCTTGCKKVCKLVKEDRKITVTCWGISEEDFCVAGPGCTGCEHCETVCNDCVTNKEEGVIAVPKEVTWRDWCPSDCADIYTHKKLMKRTETKTVPGYKWKVEDLCAACRSNAKAEPKVADTTSDVGTQPVPQELLR
jgi:hypothetical protein